jgi:CRISPR-associated protein Cas2
MLWLVAYDIRDPKRLRKIASLCEDYGRRLQYSVFVCACSREAIDALQDDACAIMDLDVDDLAVLPLCASCQDRIVQHGPGGHTALPGAGGLGLPGTSDTLIV